MVDYYSFTKEDPDLLGGVSVRDPLGLQVIWSALGRRLIPHLTEQTTRIEAFQVLVTIFNLFEKFKVRVNRDFVDLKPQLRGRSAKQSFGLQNFFFFAEQAFAFVYYNQERKWDLPGQRQVVAFASERLLSEKRPILRAQLSNGIWGLYRGAAIRAGLLNGKGLSLSDDSRNTMDLNEEYQRRSWGLLFEYITTAILDGECVISTHGHASLVQMMVATLNTLPERRLLREKLLNPPGGPIVRPLAEFANDFLRKSSDRRQLMRNAKREFPIQAVLFENIEKCEDYIGSIESIFDFLLHFKGLKVSHAAGELKVNLVKLDRARQSFNRIDGWLPGLSTSRSKYLGQAVDTTSIRSLIESVIGAHCEIADSRGATKWVSIGDDERLICDAEPFDSKPELRITPGRGWRNDYYINPLVSILRGLK